jgi:hypothetical protein
LLLHDGKVYHPWIPDSEAKFEELVNEHTAEVFGPSAEYFNIKTKTVSEAGIGSIPDGYLITFEGSQARWFIVEMELSSHPIHEHVVSQASKFKAGLDKVENRRRLADILYEEIRTDSARKERFRSRLGEEEIYHFLNELVSSDPSLLIVIDSDTKELEEAVNALRLESEIVVFRTFVHGDSLSDHVHEFNPLFEEEMPSVSPIPETDYSQIDRGRITVTLGGKRVTITREDILRASRDPRIKKFFYVGYHVELNGRKLPVKGLLSLATGIPVTEFGSTPKARGILQRLGFNVVQSQQASMRIEGPHLMQRDFEREVLLILADEQKPLRRKEITDRVYQRMQGRFSDADKAKLRVGGIRWQKNARWAITNLKGEHLIEAKAKNQYVLTNQGKDALLTRYHVVSPNSS